MQNRDTYVAFPANHLIAIVFAGERLQAGLDDAAAQAEDKVES